MFVCMFSLERHLTFHYRLSSGIYSTYLLIKEHRGEGVVKFRPPRNTVSRNVGISYARRGRAQSQYVLVFKVTFERYWIAIYSEQNVAFNSKPLQERFPLLFSVLECFILCQSIHLSKFCLKKNIELFTSAILLRSLFQI